MGDCERRENVGRTWGSRDWCSSSFRESCAGAVASGVASGVGRVSWMRADASPRSGTSSLDRGKPTGVATATAAIVLANALRRFVEVVEGMQSSQRD